MYKSVKFRHISYCLQLVKQYKLMKKAYEIFVEKVILFVQRNMIANLSERLMNVLLF